MPCTSTMFNPDHPSLRGGGGGGGAPPMSPRISFSCDFAVEPPAARSNPGPPPDPDFEFSVGSRPMIAADQLFYNGRLLPLGDNHSSSGSHRSGTAVTTLRDELRAGNEATGGQLRERPPKGPIKWKELLGLKKSRSSVKKTDKNNEGASGSAAEYSMQD